MEISVTHSLAIIAVVALVTMALRFAPFILFSGGRKLPAALEYLGKVLPGAIMGMLVVYCFRSTSFAAPTFALPELIATVTVVGLHLWRRNTLLSIAVGTLLYMALVQVVFV